MRWMIDPIKNDPFTRWTALVLLGGFPAFGVLQMIANGYKRYPLESLYLGWVVFFFALLPLLYFHRNR